MCDFAPPKAIYTTIGDSAMPSQWKWSENEPLNLPMDLYSSMTTVPHHRASHAIIVDCTLHVCNQMTMLTFEYGRTVSSLLARILPLRFHQVSNSESENRNISVLKSAYNNRMPVCNSTYTYPYTRILHAGANMCTHTGCHVQT